MHIEILTKNTGWYGSHSGYYEQLPKYILKLNKQARIAKPLDTWWSRAGGKAFAIMHGLPKRDQTITFAEEQFRYRIGRSGSVAHMMCFEDNATMLFRCKTIPRSLVATVHYPPAMMSESLITAAKRIQSIIVLYNRDLDFYEQLAGKGRVRFVRHGVDLDFFKPTSVSVADPPRLVYVGNFGRNSTMFARVANRLLERRKDLEIDVVIAITAFVSKDLGSLLSHPRIHFHHGISDDALRLIYCRSTAMLLPMNESGANNAIVEAAACGVPIATTDVGGIRDYGGISIFPVARNNDDDTLMDIVLRYLDDLSWTNEIRTALRSWAEKELSWEHAARRHLEAYEQLARTE